MSNQSRHAVGFLRFALVAALIALCALPAQAGRPGHRLRRTRVEHQRVKRHANGRVTRAAPRPAPAASAGQGVR